MTAYHRDSLDLLGLAPAIDPAAVAALDAAEARLGVRLPAAVREWYARPDAVAPLAEVNGDRPVPPADWRLTPDPAGPLLTVMHENQGVCEWSVRLDGGADPAVVVDVDERGRHTYASAFSQFVFARAWDVPAFAAPVRIAAQNRPLSPAAARALGDRFRDRGETRGWPGDRQRRFSGPGVRLLLWEGDGRTDWLLAADRPADLPAALHAVRDLDGVGANLYGVRPGDEAAFAAARSGRGGPVGAAGVPA